eukprot:1681739-Pyramimonas_sp.AAC.1
MPPPASWTEDDVPVGNREEVAYSDQCSAHTNRPPLQQDQQTRGMEWEVTVGAAEAAEAAEHPPRT